MDENSSAKTFLTSIILSKPKLKRSYNYINYTNINGPTSPPFEIKTKTIEDCAKLIIDQQQRHHNTSEKRIHCINL